MENANNAIGRACRQLPKIDTVFYREVIPRKKVNLDATKRRNNIYHHQLCADSRRNTKKMRKHFTNIFGKNFSEAIKKLKEQEAKHLAQEDHY